MYIQTKRGNEMDYKKRYLVNVRTKTIHDTLNATPRCKLKLMQQENAWFCDTLEEALNYPNKVTPRTKKCKFCINDYK